MKLVWQVDIRFSEFAHKFYIGWPWQDYFKATKVKIACGVSSVTVRDGSKLALGRLCSFDDLDLQKDWFGAMNRPSQQQLGLGKGVWGLNPPDRVQNLCVCVCFRHQLVDESTEFGVHKISFNYTCPMHMFTQLEQHRATYYVTILILRYATWCKYNTIGLACNAKTAKGLSGSAAVAFIVSTLVNFGKVLFLQI